MWARQARQQFMLGSHYSASTLMPSIVANGLDMGAVMRRQHTLSKRGQILSGLSSLAAGVFCAAVVLLAGCGQAAIVASPATVTTVHVVRTSAFPQNHIPPLERTITDAAKVQRLYDAMLAMPAFPPGVIHCSVDSGLAYRLTFKRASGQTIPVVAAPDGCAYGAFGAADRRFAANTQFWELFAATLGIPSAEVWPQPQPTGPTAPTPSA
jgi:hypothetical protein